MIEDKDIFWLPSDTKVKLLPPPSLSDSLNFSMGVDPALLGSMTTWKHSATANSLASNAYIVDYQDRITNNYSIFGSDWDNMIEKFNRVILMDKCIKFLTKGG